ARGLRCRTEVSGCLESPTALTRAQMADFRLASRPVFGFNSERDLLPWSPLPWCFLPLKTCVLGCSCGQSPANRPPFLGPCLCPSWHQLAQGLCRYSWA